jgi:hypothetical protein
MRWSDLQGKATEAGTKTGLQLPIWLVASDSITWLAITQPRLERLTLPFFDTDLQRMVTRRRQRVQRVIRLNPETPGRPES